MLLWMWMGAQTGNITVPCGGFIYCDPSASTEHVIEIRTKRETKEPACKATANAASRISSGQEEAMTDQGKKLGTCRHCALKIYLDETSPPAVWRHHGSNFIQCWDGNEAHDAIPGEQPAQGEPRITVSHGAPPAATPMPEISAEQLDEKFAKKIFDETNITGGYSEWIPTIVAILREHAALKVREYEKGLLPRVDDTLIACNREIAKLREELARTERFLEAERNNHGVSILEWEQVEAENVRLREEREALKADRKAFSKQLMNEGKARVRAESALVEARNKALDEAAGLLNNAIKPNCVWGPDCQVCREFRVVAAALLALKGQRG